MSPLVFPTEPACDGQGWMTEARDRATVRLGLKLCLGDQSRPMCAALADGTCARWLERELVDYPGDLNGVAAGKFWVHGREHPVPSKDSEYPSRKQRRRRETA